MLVTGKNTQRLCGITIRMNTLYFGDNLDILRRLIPDESVDLIYLDPPFNSNRDYNVLFKEKGGDESPAQIKAFGDTWNWAGAAEIWDAFHELCPVPKLIELMHGFHNAIGENDVMAYLVMMAPRLHLLHRTLKPRGSLYLHCDPTASHYLKLIMDCIFGVNNFGNEIIWQRTNAKGLTTKRFARNHDIILRYSRSENSVWNPLYSEHDPEYLKKFYHYVEPESGRRYTLSDITNPNKDRPNLNYEFLGVTRVWRWTKERMQQAFEEGLIVQSRPGSVPRLKRYQDEQEGMPIGDVWTDIAPLQSQASERLGYPTQKPLALLKRIILSSSNEGDIMLDPFCGCGTSIVAAQELGRGWIGIDIAPLATSLIQKRLFDSFGVLDSRLKGAYSDSTTPAYRLEGLPTDVSGARLLYSKDSTHKDYEIWAVGLVPAIPQEKRGADRGINGIAYFHDNPKKPSKAIVQVKGGHVTATQIRDLQGVMTREKAQLGFFITLEYPISAMWQEALSAGYYLPASGFGRRVEAIQIRTIEELLEGKTFDFPLFRSNVSYQRSDRVREISGQEEMLME